MQTATFLHLRRRRPPGPGAVAGDLGGAGFSAGFGTFPLAAVPASEEKIEMRKTKYA